MNREREIEILRCLSPLQNEPALVYLLELLESYKADAMEKLTTCPLDEVGGLQGSVKTYAKIMTRIRFGGNRVD